MRQIPVNELGPIIVEGTLQWPVGSEGWKRQQESEQALQQPMFAPDDLIGAPIKGAYLGVKGVIAGSGALFGAIKNVGSREIGTLLRNEIAESAAAPERKLWTITSERTERVAQNKQFGKFYKSESDGLWWAKDNAGHGGSEWKVFRETSKGLEWHRDADKYGDFIVGKHKGDVGKFIPWDKLSGTGF